MEKEVSHSIKNIEYKDIDIFSTIAVCRLRRLQEDATTRTTRRRYYKDYKMRTRTTRRRYDEDATMNTLR